MERSCKSISSGKTVCPRSEGEVKNPSSLTSLITEVPVNPNRNKTATSATTATPTNILGFICQFF